MAVVVLVSAFKVAEVGSKEQQVFNFDRVFSKYANYMKSHESQLNLKTLSRQAFLKIFLDLVDKGFLKTIDDVEVLSVNN